MGAAGMRLRVSPALEIVVALGARIGCTLLESLPASPWQQEGTIRGPAETMVASP
jgi:hypothetical protein